MSFVYFKASDTYSAVERELPVYKSVRARQSRQLDLRESILYRVGKIQSWIFCIGLPVLAILSAVGVASELEWDFVSLVLIGLSGFASLKAFPENRAATGNSKTFCLGIKAAALFLQACCIALQFTVTTPFSKIASSIFSVEPTSLIIRIIPLSVMVGLASVLHCIQRFRGKSLNRSSIQTKSGLKDQIFARDESCPWSGAQIDQAVSEDELSPHCSYSSTSSGDLSSGLPSPTGICEDKHTGKPGLEEAYRAATSKVEAHDETVYLLKFDSGLGEPYYFVHKKLRPIKIKLESVQQQGNYRPLLRTLIQRSKEKHIPAIRSVANDHVDGIRMLPIPTAQ